MPLRGARRLGGLDRAHRTQLPGRVRDEGKVAGGNGSMIAVVGPKRCRLATEYGWSRVVLRPASGLEDFLESLWHAGLSEQDRMTMVSRNPAGLHVQV